MLASGVPLRGPGTRCAFCGAEALKPFTSLARLLSNASNIGAMHRMHTTSHMRSPWRLFLGLLCVALVLLGGVLSAEHSHNDGKGLHPNCSLCVFAHAPAQVSDPPPQIALSTVYEEMGAPAPVTRPRSAPHGALFSRPPPTASPRS